MQDVAAVMKLAITASVAPLLERIDQLEKTVTELSARPTPVDGKDASQEDIVSAVERALAALPAPLDVSQVEAIIETALAGLPVPVDGKDVDPAVVAAMIKEQIEAQPKPKDGVSIDPEVVRHMVIEAVEAQPKPIDGKDADPEVMQALIASGIEAAMAARPIPQDGKSVEPETVREMITAELESWPRPQDGKSVDIADVQAMVNTAVAALPVPKDGKDADMDALHQKVADLVAAFPRPADGKDVDPAVLGQMIATAVAALPTPAPGKDADPEVVKQMVADAIAAIPAPQDGKSVDPEDVLNMVSEAVAAVPMPDYQTKIEELVSAESRKAFDQIEGWIAAGTAKVDKAIEDMPLPEKIDHAQVAHAIDVAVDTAVAAKMKELPVPQDGKDADPAQIMAMVEEVVARQPKPQDGKDADPELIRQMVQEAVDAQPKPADGKDAVVDYDHLQAVINARVDAIPTPKDGTSVTLQDVEPLIARAAEEISARITPPKDGKDADMEAVFARLEKLVEALPKAIDGKDGVGLAGAMLDADGNLVVTNTKGDVIRVGMVKGQDVDREATKQFILDLFAKQPAPKDGLGFEDMEEELLDDGRTIVRRYRRGDEVKEFRHTFSVVIDRGIWKSDREYQVGDGVSWNGCFWIAQAVPAGKPQVDKNWRLAVKAGRDGKDYEGGEKPVDDAPHTPIRFK